MNYCAPRNRNGLSAGDRAGAETLYGTSAAGHWVKTLPAQLVNLEAGHAVALPHVVK